MVRKLFVFVLVMLLAVSAYADKMVFDHIGQGSKTIVTPGTALQLSSTSQGCGILYITSFRLITHDAVTYPIYIGDSNVSAGGTWGSKKAKAGIAVVSNDVLALPVADVSMVYVDSAHTADGVTWVYLQ